MHIHWHPAARKRRNFPTRKNKTHLLLFLSHYASHPPQHSRLSHKDTHTHWDTHAHENTARVTPHPLAQRHTVMHSPSAQPVHVPSHTVHTPPVTHNTTTPPHRLRTVSAPVAHVLARAGSGATNPWPTVFVLNTYLRLNHTDASALRLLEGRA